MSVAKLPFPVFSTGGWKVLTPTRKGTSCSDRGFWFSYIPAS